jgi:nucleoid DNA-binding protein
MIMDKKLNQALIKVIREQIIKKNDVKIDGLGTFHPVHTPKRQIQYKNGRVILQPPRDSVTFTPESE